MHLLFGEGVTDLCGSPTAREAAQIQDSAPGSGSSSVYSNSNHGELLPARRYSGGQHQGWYKPAPMTPPEQTEQATQAPGETFVTKQTGQQQHCCECTCKQKATVNPSEEQYSSLGEQTVTVPYHAQSPSPSPPLPPSFHNPPPAFPTDEPDPQFYSYSPKREVVQNNGKLFGERGVLGRTPDPKEIPLEKWRRTPLARMGQKIKDLVSTTPALVDNSQLIIHPFAQVKEPKPAGADEDSFELPPGIIMKPNLAISLDPHVQAKLYSQIELMVCSTANRFLLSQLHRRRLFPDLIRKVTNFWRSKNRPQVPEFQFDQNTQREMIDAHINSLSFPGEYGINNLLLKSTMESWRAVCSEMSVRTFCYPDSVVRKHFHDLHRVLEMLGASPGTLYAFERLQVEVTNIIAQRRAEDPNNTRAHSSDEDYRYYGLRFHEPLNGSL